MPLAPPAPAAGSTSASPGDHAHRRLTAGILGLVVLGAFENRAVLSILPTIADALDGLGWYGAANAAATATLTLAGAARHPDRGPHRAAGWPGVVHRLRVPVAAVLPHVQPG